MVVRAGKFHHLFHVRTVLCRLECVCLKVYIIIHKIKGIGVQLFPLLFQFSAAHCRYKTGIDAAG